MNNLLKGLGIVSMVTIALCGCSPGHPSQSIPFTASHHDVALRAVSGIPGVIGSTAECTDGGTVVVTLSMKLEAIRNPEAIGSDAVLAVRNAVYVTPGADPEWSYRVSINGPSPGPGLVHRIGSARFYGEGIVWKEGA